MLQDGIGGLELEKPVEVLDLVELIEGLVTRPAVAAEPVPAVPALEADTVTSGRPSSAVGSGEGDRKGVGVETPES